MLINNHYYKAITTTNSFNKEQFVKNIRSGLKFKYGEVDSTLFYKTYHAEKWLSRKFTALPMGAWTLIVKTVVNIFLLVFIELPKQILGHDHYVLGRSYILIRDLQKGSGYILSLFSDRLGMFHLQESEFQKSCYQCYFSRKTHSPEKPCSQSNPITSPNRPSEPIRNQNKSSKAIDQIEEKAHQTLPLIYRSLESNIKRSIEYFETNIAKNQTQSRDLENKHRDKLQTIDDNIQNKIKEMNNESDSLKLLKLKSEIKHLEHTQVKEHERFELYKRLLASNKVFIESSFVAQMQLGLRTLSKEDQPHVFQTFCNKYPVLILFKDQICSA